MSGQLITALRNDPAERIKGAAVPDPVGKLHHQGAPEILLYFLIDAFVTQNPDASLEEGDEYENACFVFGAMEPFFIKRKDGPVSHRAIRPVMVHQGEL